MYSILCDGLEIGGKKHKTSKRDSQFGKFPIEAFPLNLKQMLLAKYCRKEINFMYVFLPSITTTTMMMMLPLLLGVSCEVRKKSKAATLNE